MNDSVIFEEPGINFCVWCPSEKDGKYYPAVLLEDNGTKEQVLVIERQAPAFSTLADAWAYHLRKIQESIAAQHTAIEQGYEVTLHALSKRAGVPLFPPISIAKNARRPA